MKKRSTYLAIREIRIKTTLGFHLTPLRMYIVNKTDAKNAGNDPGERKLTNWFKECKLIQPLWKSVWRFLRKLKE
jgi:hypothetical protein